MNFEHAECCNAAVLLYVCISLAAGMNDMQLYTFSLSFTTETTHSHKSDKNRADLLNAPFCECYLRSPEPHIAEPAYEF